MSRISVDVSSARIPVLQVGYQGENEVTDVLFDISSWITEFGEGVAQLRVKRPGNSEEESYVLSLPITDGIAVWTVSETDTFNKGNGKVQLSYMVGNILKKAVIYPYKVGKSIVGADNPVDPFDSWIERSKTWAIGETLDGNAVPETDETYQNNAKYYAEQANILGSAQVVLAAEQVTLAAEQVTLATEKADAAAASEAAVNGVSTQLTTRMSAIETEQAVQDARMDTFVALPEGSTAGNAELADIRVGANGTTYDTAGNAVRGQIGELKSDMKLIDIEGFDEGPIELGITTYLHSGTLVYLSGEPFSTIISTANAGFKYYDVPINGVKKIKATVFSQANTKGVIFTDADNTLIDYYPKNAIASPGEDLDIVCAVPSTATRVLLIGKTATVIKLYNNVQAYKMDADLSAAIATATDLSIEGYTNALKNMDGTFTNNAYIDASGTAQSLNGYSYRKISCKEGKKYYISGQAGTGDRLYVTQDINGNVIDTYPPTNPRVAVSDYEYTAPTNAATIAVNGGSLTNPIIKTYSENEFIQSNPIATKTGTYTYEVGDSIVTKMNFKGSGNETFNFAGIYLNNNLIKPVNDDICPINIVDVGYVGANHGYAWVYNCKITSHGLSESDIGKTYNDGANVFVLIQITDANNIVVGCYDSGSWLKLKRVAPTTLNFGTSLTVETATMGQLHPSVNNASVTVLENSGEKFKVLEVYDIIDVGTGIDAIIANVGNNDNSSVASLSDARFTIRNIFEFHANGSVTIYQNMKVVKETKLAFYGGIQSMAFGAYDGYAVPQTSLKTLTQTNGSDIAFARTTWDDQAVPPSLYVQTDNIGNSLSKLMFLGYIASDRNSNIYADAGKSQGSSRKMYPYLVQPQTSVPAGTVYNSVSFRVPIVNITSSQKVVSSYTYDREDVLMIVMARESVDTSIPIPSSAYGKKVTVVMADGITCNTRDAINAIDIKSSGEGYLVARLSN